MVTDQSKGTNPSRKRRKSPLPSGIELDRLIEQRLAEFDAAPRTVRDAAAALVRLVHHWPIERVLALIEAAHGGPGMTFFTTEQVDQIRAALLAALEHHGGALEPVDEPGGPESTRAFEAQMREAIRLPTGWHRSIAQSGRGGNWRRARHSRPGQ